MNNHPTLAGDIIAGTAVVASWTSSLRDDISVIVTLLAGIWYLIQIYRWWKKKE